MFRDCKKRCRCVDLIVAILGALFFATLGLILGTVFAATLIAALPTLILAAVILAILIIVRLIQVRCDNSNGCDCDNNRYGR